MRYGKKEPVTRAVPRTMTVIPRFTGWGNSYSNVREANAQIEAQNRQLREQLEKLTELDRARSRFFADISHEFRGPLSLIIGPLEQILEEQPGKELESRLNMILRHSRRLLNLVEQLLELATFDGGNMTLRMAEQDINAFVKRIVMGFQSLAQQKEILLDFQGTGCDIPLYFDPEKIERILFILLTHAFHSTPGGGSIRVSIWNVSGMFHAPGCVEISVRDTGVGIPPDQLLHIFDRFYRGQSAHEYRRKAADIGLALTRELVELHHGDIEVRSNCRPGPTRGTEFIIRLPMGHAHFQPEEIRDSPGYEPMTGHELTLPVEEAETGTGMYGPEDPQTPGDKPTVLVVDDNADLRSYVRGMLAPQFNVTEAADGIEGMARTREMLPDLVICDIMMPGLDGYDVCRRIKEDIKTSHIPVILLTARASENNIIQGLEYHADDYITKPFNARILTGRVKNLIRLRRQLQRKLRDDILSLPGENDLSSLDQKFMEELAAKIEENLSDPDFRVEQLAKQLLISPSGLYKKVEALTGRSPQLFLRSYRLARAAKLLNAKFGNVTEVAFAVGFSSASYFTKCFKEKFGKQPSQWSSG